MTKCIFRSSLLRYHKIAHLMRLDELSLATHIISSNNSDKPVRSRKDLPETNLIFPPEISTSETRNTSSILTTNLVNKGKRKITILLLESKD